MESVKKFGLRGGRFAAIESNIVSKLCEHGFCAIYFSSEKFSIDDLIENLTQQLGLAVSFEAIPDRQKVYDTALKCFVLETKVIGYNLFLKK